MVSQKTLDYLEERAEDARLAVRRAQLAGDDDAVGDLQAELMEAQAELSNARYYDSLEA